MSRVTQRRARSQPAHWRKNKSKIRARWSVLIVHEACTEPANIPDQDRCEDITHLTFLNESSSLHTLRQRFGGKLVHTFCGNQLVTINPRHQLAAYSDKVMGMFKGCRREEVPPHIYSIAQSAYRNLMKTSENQVICPLGISGQSLKYFAVYRGSYPWQNMIFLWEINILRKLKSCRF